MVLCKMLHLLVRDVSGNITCMLSMKGEWGLDFSLNICITFWKTAQLDSNQQFCLFFKDNSIILRQFENFFIPLPAIRYISYQEMKINWNNKKVQNLTKKECKVKMKSQVDRKFDSRSQLLHSTCATACLSDKKRSKQE